MKTKSKVIVETRNSEVFLRPRFSVDLQQDFQSLLNRFKETFEKKETRHKGTIVDGHIFISVPKKDEHFWSPQLHLELIEQEDKTTLLKGLFGPKPQVWTLFMFVHFLLGVAFLGFGVLLYTRMRLHDDLFLPVTMMIAIPFVWVIMYFLGKIGKSTGKNQMRNLHDFMWQVLDKDL